MTEQKCLVWCGLFCLCWQILPGMSDILSYIPSMNPRVQQPCLQFTYWSVVFMEQTVQGSQVMLTASIIIEDISPSGHVMFYLLYKHQ